MRSVQLRFRRAGFIGVVAGLAPSVVEISVVDHEHGRTNILPLFFGLRLDLLTDYTAVFSLSLALCPTVGCTRRYNDE